MKSTSFCSCTLVISGKEVTWCFFPSSIFRYGPPFYFTSSAAWFFSLVDFFFFRSIFFSSYASKDGFLYSQSPIALDTAIIPYTLPSSTNPPPAFILFISPSLSGLWSLESSVTFPALFTKIALESPAFEQYTTS